MRSKTRIVANIQLPQRDRISIVYHYEDANPFHIVKKWYGYNKIGYCTEKKRTLVKYADWHSCLYYLLTLENMERIEEND